MGVAQIGFLDARDFELNLSSGYRAWGCIVNKKPTEWWLMIYAIILQGHFFSIMNIQWYPYDQLFARVSTFAVDVTSAQIKQYNSKQCTSDVPFSEFHSKWEKTLQKLQNTFKLFQNGHFDFLTILVPNVCLIFVTRVSLLCLFVFYGLGWDCLAEER